MYAWPRHDARQWRQLTGSLERLEDARVPVQHMEQLAVDGFGGTDEHISVPSQRIVECGADLGLHVAVEIDQQVPAGDQVDM
jgi:hypothetical protein